MNNSNRNQRICNLYQQNFSCRQLAKRFSISFQRIHQILEENRIKLRGRGLPILLTKQKTLEIYQEYIKDRKSIQNHEFSYGSIMQSFREHHLKMHHGRIAKFTKEQILRVHKFYMKGLSLQNAAKLFEVAHTTLIKYFRHYNLYVRHQGWNELRYES